ncbi:HotDog domain [Syntrophomonas zehnderi OL-4]|uniref:HotDog domain n=1 Tax=Syntrophomonas zehnderi OL-4 TaxID=690567 RepID=A0A0E4G8T8_9FIRM|nr:PaaI family thioesterase [Syntrophomonas zehnderi]CFW97565.1 HotDog domain [Syntrophomonas zehnderi OL-4]
MAAAQGQDKQLFDHIKHSIQTAPIYQLLGINMQRIESGFIEMTVKLGEIHTNALGIIQGGVIMTLADAAMGNAVRTLGIKGVTVDCSVSFPGAAQLGDTLIAQGKVIKAGKNLVFAQADVYTDDKLIGSSQATFFNTGKLEY